MRTDRGKIGHGIKIRFQQPISMYIYTLNYLINLNCIKFYLDYSILESYFSKKEKDWMKDTSLEAIDYIYSFPSFFFLSLSLWLDEKKLARKRSSKRPFPQQKQRLQPCFYLRSVFYIRLPRVKSLFSVSFTGN